MKVFVDVLRAASSAGVDQIVLDGGRQIGKLLMMFHESARRTEQSRELMPHVDGLLARWRERYEPTHVLRPQIGVAELLSVREKNIMNLIARGKTNKEIARGLGIAPETVKSHVKHIFVKLDVDKRTRAVARAQSLGIVSTQ
jgi:LuxR family maltose regulon positive regulatory protein